MMNATHTPKRALVVDDQPLTRGLLSNLLMSHGIEVEDADSGEAALDKWLQHQHPLVITDCHMPGMSGYALARALREIEPSINLPRTTIIGWSANHDEVEKSQCLSAGMDDFLAKPINMKQLDGMLAKHHIELRSDSTQASHPIPNQDADSPLVIDQSILDAVVPDRVGQPKVLEYLLNCMKRDAKQLQQYATDSDAHQMKQIAHRMKGASKMVGAQGIAFACEAIEHSMCLADLNQVTAMLSTLDQRIIALEQYLSRLR
jgi:two-component system, NarL family, sensor histidine kinase EvgS